MLYIPIDDILILCKDHKIPLLPRHMKTYSELGGWIESWALGDNVVSHTIYRRALCSVQINIFTFCFLAELLESAVGFYRNK